MLRLQSFFSNNCDVVCLYAHLPLLQHRKRFVSSIGPTVAYMSLHMGPGNNAMRSFLDYMLILIVRVGAGSALVMVKNLCP